MVAFKHKPNKKILIAVTVPLAVILLLVLVCAIYLGDYYRADLGEIEAFMPEKSFSVETLADDTLVFSPENATVGLIFYPGGKVEYTAYAPLMRALADNGILCVLTEMPLNLAVLDMNAADGIPEQYPQVTRWYIGGHSLGGSMAASHAAKNADRYEGLVLLASYSTADLIASGLDVISLYGSEDGVLNMEKYEKYRTNLPSDATELVLDGGCHAYFGVYGAQDGDGIPTITNEEQIRLTAEAVAAVVYGE